MAQPEPGTVTRLLQAWSGGDKQALNHLLPLVYRELRAQAAAYLRRERSGHTLQPTALVHEAYLRLVEQSGVDSHNRAQFFAVAANLMRQILVNHAHRRATAKRGGGNKVTLEEDAGTVQAREVDLIALDVALNQMERIDPRQTRIVELRFFGGLTEREIGDVMGVSERTVKRDWRIARAVLHQQLSTAPNTSE